jgi:hypothetical protein
VVVAEGGSLTATDDIEALMESVHDLVASCRHMGLKPPTAITFKTGSACNLISEHIVALKTAGHAYAKEHVTVNAKGRVEIEGVVLTVAWL